MLSVIEAVFELVMSDEEYAELDSSRLVMLCTSAQKTKVVVVCPLPEKVLIGSPVERSELQEVQNELI